jgi:hypothetical protein
MLESKRPHGPRESALIFGALASLAVLGGGIAVSPDGAIDFLQSVEEGNSLSVLVLALLIGAIFVVLHRLGMSFGSAEKIGPHEARTAGLSDP